MRRYQNSVSAVDAKAADRVDGTPAPAVFWRTALRLAVLRTAAVIAAVVTGALVWGSVHLYESEIREEWVLLAGGVALLVGGTFVVSLWGYTNLVRRATWMQEAALGMDLDGDGHVGDPQRARVRLVPVRSARGDEDVVSWVEEKENEELGPILEGFELDAVDVAAFVSEAGRRGLAASAWLEPGQPRYRLPSSGERVVRSTWERVTAELVRIGWARNNGPGGLHLTRSTPELLRELREWM